MGYRLVGCETLITYFGKVPISEHSMGGGNCVLYLRKWREMGKGKYKSRGMAGPCNKTENSIKM